MRLATAPLLFFLIFSAFKSGAQDNLETINEEGVYYLKQRNGSNAVLMPIPSATKTEITLMVTGGSAYESDTMNGVAYITQRVLANKIMTVLRSGPTPLSTQNTTLTSTTNSEQTVFKIVIDETYTAEALKMLVDNVMKTTIEEEEVRMIVDTVLQEIELAKLNPRAVMESRLMQAVYRSQVEKIDATQNPEELRKIDIQAVVRSYKKYYVPNNVILLVTGNFKNLQVVKLFEDLFGPLSRSEFDPDFITKIPDFRPMVYNTQFIVEDSLTQPEFHIMWQFPGTSSNKQSSYHAILLAEILNDKNNFIQVKAAKMGCKKLEARYEASKYTGILRVIVQPDTAQVWATYKFVMDQLLRLEKTLVNESMINAGKLQFEKEYQGTKRTKEYAENIVTYWAYKDETYYREVMDSVLTIQEKRFRNFIIQDLNLQPHVTALLISKADRERLQIDSVFAEINDSVGSYVFRYLQNVYDLEGPENMIKLRNLLQWLLINKEVNIQVNGFADEGEFNKARDKAVMQFLDSVPTFRKVTNDIIEKGYMRPEMMRAIKIVKYLYENGVEAERLSGTAMKFSSETEEEAIENAKCTVTLNKLHKGMPLREYYYGKPKQ